MPQQCEIMQILLGIDRYLLLLNVKRIGHHLTPLPDHCSSLFLLKLLMFHPYYCRVARIRVDRTLRCVLIPVWHFRVGKLSQRLWLIGLLLDSAGIKLFGFIRSILDSHCLLAALVSFGGGSGLFGLDFLLVLLFVIVDHVSEER